ncbi:putative Zn-dependent protease [Kushneria sinocarnis]|uniref:Putative beta-barrel assembly-enhancing protease n=1 Tax=Kushneria sinocarnis TaxID=595502 RepID=A0A420WZL6_9GAMM|nr:M48 family metalloprotease [Kushneria sinocarnis]RKR06665.1 putative Zn-dependent protease [Kushneria sinocarnis]
MPGFSRKRSGCLLLAGTLLIASLSSSAEQRSHELPDLGTTRTSFQGLSEYQLGRTWLRQFRAQTSQWRDPITQAWLRSLVDQLVPCSQLDHPRITITLVSSRMLNAFAVPGGVVGVNTGLFRYAPSHDAFASVVAHELGHLSQHHFARQMAASERAQLPTMAALLAGMVIAAGAGGSSSSNLGMATIAGTQAAALQNQLAYSRQYEQEADRVGLQTMACAGMDPDAMAHMFATMAQLASLQGDSPPEFLLTHPLTQSRLSDIRARAKQYHDAAHAPGPEYDMIRARVMLASNMEHPEEVRSQLRESNASPLALRYLQALVDSVNHHPDQALAAFDRLAEEQPDLLMLPASAADAALDADRNRAALQRAQRILELAPDYFPARMIAAEAQLGIAPEEAFTRLRAIARDHDEDPDVWNLMAEAAGRSGHDAWGHLALAEQLQLTGHIDRGLDQLDIAEKLSQQTGDYALTGRIRERRQAFRGYQQALDKF